MIDWMYLPGSANCSAVGRKTGHSGSSCADLASAQCLYEVPYRVSVASHLHGQRRRESDRQAAERKP